jgi:hypothetical protein
MKKTIKTITTVIAGLALTLGLTLTSCQKGDIGPKGDTGATGATGQSGPQAKTFNFSLTYNAGEKAKSYSGITGFNTDDVVLVYALTSNYGGTSGYYVQLPYVSDGNGTTLPPINFWSEFNESNGLIFVNTTKVEDGSSPWLSTITLDFKAVLISSSQRNANPNLDLTNYNEVKKAFNLKD